MADRSLEPSGSRTLQHGLECNEMDSNASETVEGSGSELCGSTSTRDGGDGWEIYDSDSDGSIPDPDEILHMPKKGPLFDWKRVSKIANGPICYKCFLWSPYLDCERCCRSFHRECLLMDPGYPDPIFDVPLEVVCMANFDESKLIKCPICIISEQTYMPKFSNVSQDELNKTLFLIAQYTHAEFGIDILPNIPTSGITTAEIKEKAARGEYKTIEGFYNDYKLIQYFIVKKYATESEENDVAKTVMITVETYLHVMVACMDCVKAYFNADGRPYHLKEFSQVIRQPCSAPHAVLWIKEEGFPFWPAKILSHDPVKKRVLIQFFGETAVGKFFPFPSDETLLFQTFSSVFPDRKPKKSEKKWSQACVECKEYLKNLREKFGEEGVVVPQNSEKFNGDLEAYKRTMFPLYAFENEQNEDVPNPKPEDTPRV